jgi:poly[ADP-ribose] polymerase 16
MLVFKIGLYGNGTYLSNEPNVSLHFSPSSKTWNHSLIGQRMSCLLVCEIINDPNHVQTGLREKISSSNSNQKTIESNKTIPEKYFLVLNNEYVRVRYVILYAEKFKPKK